MKLIFTKSKLPLSLLIRAITGEDCSHMALVFESRSGGIMFESNFLGTHPKFFRNASKHFTVVHALEIPMTVEQEDHAWDTMVDAFDGKNYDFGAAIYLGWRILLYRWFRRPVPKVNCWQTKGAFFCDEVYQILEMAGFQSLDVESGMKTPFMVWDELKSKGFVDIQVR